MMFPYQRQWTGLFFLICFFLLSSCGGGGGNSDGDDDNQSSAGYSQLGASVESLKFYEGSSANVPAEDRVYGIFYSSTTRFVFYELHLTYPKPGQSISFTLDFDCHGPDGKIFAEASGTYTVEGGWTGSVHTVGNGWDTPGNWPAGEYTVNVYDAQSHQRIASETFTVQDDDDEAEEPGATESDVTVLDQPGETDPATGLPLRPHTRLDHPSGAWADVPESPVRYSELVDLKRIAFPDNSLAWNWNEVAWQFISAAGLVIKDGVTLALPGAGGDSETVLALSHTGDWIEIPSAPVTLKDGLPGRQVEVSDIPAPWILVVAQPSGTPASVDSPVAKELEQLYWTDREEWKSKTIDALSEIDFSAEIEEPEDGLVSLEIERMPYHVRKDLDVAYQVLGAARYGGVLDMTAIGTPLPVIGVSPFALYMNGLDRLSAVRKEWNQKKSKWQSQRPDDLFYSDDQSLEQAIESALAFYAPWGIDMTRFMLHTGTIGAFDMRVIGPYGELLYADAPLSNTHENNAIGINVTELKAKGVTANCYLRLYSRLAMQDTWVDWLKDWKLQTVVRWAPSLLVTAGVVSGAATPAVLFAAADQLISFVQDHYTEDEASTYLNLEAVSMSGSAGAFVVDAGAGIMGVEGATTSIGATSLGVAQTVYSVALLYGVSQTDWYMLQEVRSLTTGTRSYCPRGDCVKDWWTGDAMPVAGYDQIPPVQVVAVLQDVPPGHPADGYPAQRTRLQVWTLPLPKYGADLHRIYSSGGVCEASALGMSQDELCPYKGKWSGGIADIPFETYKKEAWPEIVQHTAPAAQTMRLSVPKTVLAAIASEYELGAKPKPSDYGISIRAAASDGSRAVFVVDEFLDPKPGESTDNIYFQVLIEGKWKGVAADLSDVEPEHDGIRSTMSGKTLQTKLTLELMAHSDETPRASGNVDFTAKGIEDIEIYPNVSGEAHLHFAKAALAPEEDVFGIYDITRWELLSGDPGLISTYNKGYFTYSPRCAAEGCCTFEVLQYASRLIANVCGCPDGASRSCKHMADSETYKESYDDSDLLAPLANDNFFKLENKSLTGSAAWNWYGNPGEPAIVGGWHTISATFDKGMVTGTITQHQRNDESVITMQFAFEGQLQK